jgi:hypothetical protein
MSAALMLPQVWGESAKHAVAGAARRQRAPMRESEGQPAEELAFYRKHTQSLLRRYMHMSMQMGRAPSVLGDCMFRGRVSSYRMRSFEDAVIFVFDIEKCLKRLDQVQQDFDRADRAAGVHAGRSGGADGDEPALGGEEIRRGGGQADGDFPLREAAHDPGAGTVSRGGEER